MRVGIALAVYRPHPEFFKKQLESIEAQTYSDWFCIGTLDSPLAEIFQAPGLARFKDHPKFQWVENEKQLGVTKNFEKAIQLCVRAGAEVIACADQDDVWYKNKIARSVEVLSSKPSMGLLHTDMDLLYPNDQGEETVAKETGWQVERRGVDHSGPGHFLIRNVVAGCSMLFDAELVERYPVIPPEFYHPDHWYPFLASVYGGVYALHEPTLAYRQHPDNTLGITPFRGVFALSGKKGAASVLKRSRQVYLWSRDMARAALREKVPVPFCSRFPILSFDMGLSFVLMGFYYLVVPSQRDAALARACFARAVGKLLFFMSALKPESR